jgi:hypothetical protein
VRIRIAKGWRLLVLAAFLIVSGCGWRQCTLSDSGCTANQQSPADHGCLESGGPNSRCSCRRF